MIDHIFIKNYKAFERINIPLNKNTLFIGTNASGKTTILRILMTLETIDDGFVSVNDEYLWHEKSDGKIIPASENHLHKMRDHIGMVFQQFNLFPHLTAIENEKQAELAKLNELELKWIEVQAGIAAAEANTIDLQGSITEAIRLAKSNNHRAHIMGVIAVVDPVVETKITKSFDEEVW